jgi:uncharacterized membrane-anchored protein YitT (DUF2179 family)
MFGKKLSKREVLKIVRNYILILLGCALLAFGDVAFITPLHLVTGGVLSVGVIVQYFVDLSGATFQVYDIVAWILQVILLVVGFFFLGKKFTLHTLFASLMYPAFLTIFSRFHLTDFVSNQLINPNGDNTALTILAGIFGGAFVGAGVAVTYFGDGSTGGFDIVSIILAKYTPVKEASSAFMIDGTLVIIGMICMKDIPLGLIGILSALVCALVVQYSYVNANSFVIADIVSEKYEEIMQYVHEKMDHATTVINATGGYTGTDRKILRVAFSKRELFSFKAFIAECDPKAFVTFTQASMINGEGFDPLVAKVKLAVKLHKKNEKENDGE